MEHIESNMATSFQGTHDDVESRLSEEDHDSEAKYISGNDNDRVSGSRTNYRVLNSPRGMLILAVIAAVIVMAYNYIIY